MKLTTREKSALIMEAFVTIVILLLVNLSVIVILNDMIQTNPGLQDGIFIIKRSMVIGRTTISCGAGRIFLLA